MILVAHKGLNKLHYLPIGIGSGDPGQLGGGAVQQEPKHRQNCQTARNPAHQGEPATFDLEEVDEETTCDHSSTCSWDGWREGGREARVWEKG